VTAVETPSGAGKKKKKSGGVMNPILERERKTREMADVIGREGGRGRRKGEKEGSTIFHGENS